MAFNFDGPKFVLTLIVTLLIALGGYIVYNTIKTGSGLKLPIYFALIAIAFISLARLIMGLTKGVDSILIHVAGVALSIVAFIYLPKLNIFSAFPIFSTASVGVKLDTNLAISISDPIVTFIQNNAIYIVIGAVLILFYRQQIARWWKGL